MFQEEKRMDRKIAVLALTLTLTAALAGCGSTASTTPTAPAVAPTDSPMPDVTGNPDIVSRGRRLPTHGGQRWNRRKEKERRICLHSAFRPDTYILPHLRGN